MNTELDSKDFFLKIANSVALLLLWMMPNLYYGLYKGYAFFEGKAAVSNIVYYLISGIGFALVIFFFIKKKKK